MSHGSPEPPEGPLQRLAQIAWQALLVAGLVSLGLGIIVLAWPKETLLVVGVLFGLYLLIIGVVQLIAAFGTHTTTALRVLAFVSGTLCILLGLLCFRSAARSLVLLSIWIGIGWLFRGVTQLAAVASDPAMPGRGWQGLSGGLNLAAGIILMVFPVGSVFALTVLAGCWLLVTGLMEIVTAFRIRHRGHELPAGT